MATRVCPHCGGSGIVGDPRDTMKMSKDEFDAAMTGAIRTPIPPPPETPFTLSLPEERVTLPSDSWMVHRVKRMKRSSVWILAEVLFLFGLSLLATVLLVTRGC